MNDGDKGRVATSPRRQILAAVLVLPAVAALLALIFQLEPLGSPRAFLGRLAAVGLLALLVAYPLAASGAAFGLLGVITTWHWRRPREAALRISYYRWLSLASALLLAVFAAESLASVWLAYRHRLPRLSGQALAGEHPIEIAVIGGSSALGVPYENWLSVGKVVEHGLGQVFPRLRFHARVLAEPGAALESQHQKLAALGFRPDVIIVYSGHNEFLARFAIENRSLLYYDDERPPVRLMALLEQTGRLSPVFRLIQENLAQIRVGMLPAHSQSYRTWTIGRPVASPAEFRAVFSDFEARLEAIATDCEQLGSTAVFVIPPGNDAADPNQSCARPGTTEKARHALFARLQAVRDRERSDPQSAREGYERLLDDQPNLAIAHHRLARLYDQADQIKLANAHYIQARDADGLPLRCISPLEAIYRKVAGNHPGAVILVDGPAVLRAASPRGILDNEMFHDLVHPTLEGHVLLARAVLEGLKQRGFCAWPADAPVPDLDASWAEWEFGIDREGWARVCERSAAQYDMMSFLTPDPQERYMKRDRYLDAMRRIRAGEDLAVIGVPGVGVRSRAPSGTAVKAGGIAPRKPAFQVESAEMD